MALWLMLRTDTTEDLPARVCSAGLDYLQAVVALSDFAAYPIPLMVCKACLASHAPAAIAAFDYYILLTRWRLLTPHTCPATSMFLLVVEWHMTLFTKHFADEGGCQRGNYVEVVIAVQEINSLRATFPSEDLVTSLCSIRVCSYGVISHKLLERFQFGDTTTFLRNIYT